MTPPQPSPFELPRRPISREELELERIIPIDGSKIYCEYDNICTRRGQFQRCNLDIYIYCPFATAYFAQGKDKN